MESVQKFFNTNQYKILGLLFLAGMFYAEYKFTQKSFELYKQQVVEEFKDLEKQIIDLEEQVNYNESKVDRQILHSETETQLTVDNKLLKLQLKEAKEK